MVLPRSERQREYEPLSAGGVRGKGHDIQFWCAIKHGEDSQFTRAKTSPTLNPEPFSPEALWNLNRKASPALPAKSDADRHWIAAASETRREDTKSGECVCILDGRRRDGRKGQVGRH